MVHRSTAISLFSILFVSFPGCLGVGRFTETKAVAVPHFPKSVVEPKHVDRAIAAEEAIALNSGTLPQPDEPWFAFRPGTSAVMFTAPHATQPMRDGDLRFADSGTGSLAILLNEIACTPVLYTTMASPADPNRYDESAFKIELSTRLDQLRPVILVDLHGSDPSRPYDVDFGTISGTSLLTRSDLLDDLIDALKVEGVLVFSSARFDATGRTITRWASSKGTPAIQLEINSTWLSHALPAPNHVVRSKRPATGLLNQRFARILQALTRFSMAVDKAEGRPTCLPIANER